MAVANTCAQEWRMRSSSVICWRCSSVFLSSAIDWGGEDKSGCAQSPEWGVMLGGCGAVKWEADFGIWSAVRIGLQVDFERCTSPSATFPQSEGGVALSLATAVQ